jgi:lycopene cyclase domain-containing protein
MSEYLLINIAIILIPLLFSFENKIKFYLNFLPLFFSILFVSSAYIIWDISAATRGDWSFNELYILGIKLFGLPLEEVLFFITVPYSIIFIYETLKYYLKENEIFFNKYFYFFLSAALILTGLNFNDQPYTFIVLIFTGFFFPGAILFYPKLLASKIFWLTILISFIPFLAVNYLLTSIPIVTYNSSAIWGIRFITIPLEDFFYSFSMISYWLLFYISFKEKLGSSVNSKK